MLLVDVMSPELVLDTSTATPRSGFVVHISIIWEIEFSSRALPEAEIKNSYALYRRHKREILDAYELTKGRRIHYSNPLKDEKDVCIPLL